MTTLPPPDASAEIKRGDRFAFGANWTRFLQVLNEEKIERAQRSMADLFGMDSFINLTFLDIGSGSGLSSLVAARMGAQVQSMDFDPQSVACTEELRYRHFSGSFHWKVEKGSALDSGYMRGLGHFDIVYSWGVLHHTGNMWLGIENAIGCVKPKGKLMLAIYNDQGWKSRVWWLIKATYNRLPGWMAVGGSYLIYYPALAAVVAKSALSFDRVRLKRLFSPLDRGMSRRHDMIDWMGGFPFEFATVAVLRDYMAARGFTMEKAIETKALGCHQLVFCRA
ncbi:MAG TPA: class I SAM-dependent methyltransferase [Opitutaceae bacterium]